RCRRPPPRRRPHDRARLLERRRRPRSVRMADRGGVAASGRDRDGGGRMRLRLGLSTCPNDTFAFHAILQRRIDLRGLEFDAARPGVMPSPGARVLCPGETTTATLLYRSLHPGMGTIRHAVFSDVGAALRRGDADLGVLIHEGRLTYERDGLSLVEDLGQSF